LLTLYRFVCYQKHFTSIFEFGGEIFYQDNEFKIKTLEKMPVFGIFVPLTTIY